MSDNVVNQWLNYFLSGQAAKGPKNEQGVPMSWAANKAKIKEMFINLPDLTAEDMAAKEATCIFFDVQENSYDQSPEIMLIVYNRATGHAGAWRGSLSSAYIANSNEAWYEVTFRKLESAGLKDRSNWSDMLGMTIPVWIDEYESKKGAKSIIVKSIGASKKKVARSLDMRQIFGITPIQEGFSEPAAAPAAPATAPTPAPAAAPAANPYEN